MIWNEWAHAQLDSLRRADRLRRLETFDGAGPVGFVRGRSLISFATNDYLGLASHVDVRRAAIAAIERYGTGSRSSRLLAGTYPVHAELEAELASWKHTERALVFPTGFATNSGVLPVLATTDTTIFSDALNHASIIDGCRLANAATAIYRHADMDHLRALLRQTAGRKLIVTESVFSMDGDIAPLDELVRLSSQHHALLVVDEAHAVLGPEIPAPDGLELLRIGTLSKVLGSVGGWVAGSSALIELLLNRARSFIYSTGSAPADVAAALAALRILRSHEGRVLRTQLREHIDRLRPGHPAPIIPIICGTDRRALAAAEHLLAHGIHVPAVRPPTVASGTARLRIALSAAHTADMIDRLRIALSELENVGTAQCHAT